MKIFFFFFLLIPMAAALAVTPTSLDISDKSLGKLYIYNTLNTTVNFQVHGIYTENFSLEANEVKVLEISYSEGLPGRHETALRIEEIYENSFVNAIEIPVYYSGKMQESTKGFKNLEKIYLGVSMGLAFFLCAFYVWKRKRKKHVQSLSL